MTEPAPSARGRSSLRATLIVAAVAIVIAGGSRLARATAQSLVKVNVMGKLSVPAGAPLSVIATDPVLQRVLSQDLQVAGRLAGADFSSVTTVTVTMSQRVLAPGMSLNDVAPGDHSAVALLKSMGVRSLPMPSAPPQSDGGDGQAGAEGGGRQPNDIQSYERQGRDAEAEQGAVPLNPFPMMPWPVPPATAQERSALPSYMPPAPNYEPGGDRENATAASATYDTIFIARATAGQGSGTLTVIAVGHPGYDRHQLQELIAEEIANSLLH